MTTEEVENEVSRASSLYFLDYEADVATPQPVRRRSRLAKGIAHYWGSAVLALLILVIWQVVVRATHTPGYLISAPTDIVRAFGTDWHILWPAAITTTEETAIGFTISVAAGIGIAVLLHLFPLLRRATYPLLLGSQTIPVVVLAPILVILLGYGIMPKLVIIALFCFFPIVINGLDGLRSTDESFVHMMRTLDATRWSIFRRVQFPGALPAMFTGMRIAATYASIGAVFGEWAGSNQGLGYVILESTPNLLTARIFASIVLLTGMSLSLFGIVALIERLVVPWAPRTGSR